MVALRGTALWFLICLAAVWVQVMPTPSTHSTRAQAYYAGWAVEAYPELSYATMEAMVRRQVANGANVVWIGHNNPGEAVADKVEPGLSYAVYQAYTNPDDSRHEAASEIIKAQHRMLTACRASGVKAVLPVGYQIQMGQTWNEAHPGDLRLDAQGNPLDIYGGGVSASFYAPSYRQAITAYYRWLDAEFVGPYADVLLMLNLADEPIGGDYGPHAEAEFKRANGFGFDGVGDDPDRQRLLGQFQSHYVVEYAAYSASLWNELQPNLPVTMSFDGAQARTTFSMPDVEPLFRDTPDNFVVTFDAYPRDGLPNVAMEEHDLVGLFLLARSLGLYSGRYGKPVWLWAAANSWGLSQASGDPGTVSDALANGLYLALLVRQGGGYLQGIAYWNYNVKEQGLYDAGHTTAYDVETMFSQVSGMLPALRALMASPSGEPQVLVLAPPGVSHQRIGAASAPFRLDVQPYQRLEVLARHGVQTAIVSGLDGWHMENVQTIVVLSPNGDYLTAADAEVLRTFFRQGGVVVASPGVGALLTDSVDSLGQVSFGGLVEVNENLYVARKGIAVLFEDRRAHVLSGFWQEALGIDALLPGFRVITDEMALYYHPGREPIQLRAGFPFEAQGYRYNDNGYREQAMDGAYLNIELGRREFVLLRRAKLSHPWIQ